MHRAIKDATVRRFHYDSHDQLHVHLADFMLVYNFVHRLKTLSGLIPSQHICKIWKFVPDRHVTNPIHQVLGPNSQMTN